MGEARRRGTFEERKKQSVERQARERNDEHKNRDDDEGRLSRNRRRHSLLLSRMAVVLAISSIK